MSMLDRAAQFSPFDALTGYEEDITEEGRLTDQRTALSEQQMEIMNKKLARLSELCDKTQHERFLKESDQVFPIVTVRFFVPDTKLHKHSKKSGGAYKSYTGPVRQIDFIEGKLIFKSDRPGQKEVVVPIADVVELNSEELDQVENRYE
jgi:hypothetical protein